MNVILCGYHWSGCKALDVLLKNGHNVFVFTHKNPYHIPSLIDFCYKTNTLFSLCDISNSELPFSPDIICSISYRYIIKKHIIDLCGGKIFNLHPSLLPKYRGCSSLTWAMINGEKEVGYTYHYVDEGTDTGKIIIQKRVILEEFDTQETLYIRVMTESMKEFYKAFSKVVDGIAGVEQEGVASYYSRGCPHNGMIDMQWDYEYKNRFIRAMIYPPYSVAKLGKKAIYSFEDLPKDV